MGGPVPASREIPTIALCALLLGRLQIGLTRGSPAALRVFAARLLRESLIAALRQEGHQFTDDRFSSWCAGLQTLTDLPNAALRPPKAICRAILTELCHSTWHEMACAAECISQAFLAPSDLNDQQHYTQANMAVSSAQTLISNIAPSDEALPFAPLRLLFAAAANATLFARNEQGTKLLEAASLEVSAPRNSTWALDILAGTLLSPHHGLPVPVPLPGLIALPQIQSNPHGADLKVPDEAILTATYNAFARLDQWLAEAERQSSIIQERLVKRRSSGRSRQLAEILAGLGMVSGKQIALLLGTTRVGADLVAAALEDSGLLVRDSRRHAHRVFRYTHPAFGSEPHSASSGTPSLTSAAIAEYDDVMREIDELLNRRPAPRT